MALGNPRLGVCGHVQYRNWMQNPNQYPSVFRLGIVRLNMDRLAIISDSHIPERASELPDPFRERIRSADQVIHAGDFTSDDVLTEIESLADGHLTAVYGNMDPRNLALPAVDTLTTEGVTFVVTHGTGTLEGYEERVTGIVREEADENAIGIAGHTHEVLDTTREGIRLLNPGSITGAPPASRATMMIVDVDDRDVKVTVQEA